MKRLTVFSILAIVLLVAALVATIVVMPVSAGPGTQIGQDFPTPTSPAVEIEPVEVQRVGGSTEVQTYEGEEIDGVTIGETTAVSEYPAGAPFTVTIESEKEVNTVNLVVRYPHNSGTRALAERTDNENEWRAVVYDLGNQPPWQEFNFYWSISFIDGTGIETTPHFFVYSDPTREWLLSETPLLKLYWFDRPDEFGQVAQEGMAAMQDRWTQGFGQPLSYTPIAVLFPDLSSFAEFRQGGEDGSRRLAGFTSSDLGMTVQRFVEQGRDITCPAYPPADKQDDAWLFDYTTSVITHEVAHLYQYENNIGGPTWLIEGGATWFSLNPDRGGPWMRDRAEDSDYPTFQGPGPSTSSNLPNGCNALAYWQGSSMYQYIYGAYGMEAIGILMDRISRNFRLDDALTDATGQDLAGIEQEWRDYMGLKAEVRALPTIEMRFPPTVTPYGQ